MTKTKLEITAIALIAILAFLGVRSFLTPKPAVNLGLFNIGACYPTGQATSTPIVGSDGVVHNYILSTNAFFISANATSTFECNIGNADIASLNIQMYGSTTAAYPTFDYQVSEDQSGWYTPTYDAHFNTVALDGKVQLSTTTMAFYGNDSSGSGTGFSGRATTSVSALLTFSQAPSTLGHRWVRVHIGAGGGVATVHVELIPRNQY